MRQVIDITAGISGDPSGDEPSCLIDDYAWYSLSELVERHQRDVEWTKAKASADAYREGVSLATEITKISNHSDVTKGDHVQWVDFVGFYAVPFIRTGEIIEIDGYGRATVRAKVAGGFVTMKSPIDKLNKA